ncbi:MAG: glycosyl transferase [Bacteroidales bacterium]|nr:glycosyl transferase [Bacteroidales bacterium]
MKHAYLILAHSEFGVLRHLIQALDDGRNDVYVHIDKRVKSIPSFDMTKGRLTILEDRIKTYWGDSSLMEAELLLLQTAKDNDSYQYYHIVSGVHFPLKTQDYIHSFMDSHYPKSLLMTMETNEKEIKYKTGRYHFFVHSLAPKGTAKEKAANFLWRTILFLQKPFPVRKVKGIEVKASQWCSLSDKAVDYVLEQKEFVLKRFRHTFCCDEFFIPFLLKKGGLEYESVPDLLYAKFRRYSPKVLGVEDYEDMIASGCLFARKFGKKSAELIEKVERQLI